MTGILDIILRMSLYGALVGLAALAVSRALNHLRAPKGVALMLWAIAALRLLCPVALSSSLSVMNAAPQPPRIDFKSSYTGNYPVPGLRQPRYQPYGQRGLCCCHGKPGEQRHRGHHVCR